jgi:hypothetical protein
LRRQVVRAWRRLVPTGRLIHCGVLNETLAALYLSADGGKPTSGWLVRQTPQPG